MRSLPTLRFRIPVDKGERIMTEEYDRRNRSSQNVLEETELKQKKKIDS